MAEEMQATGPSAAAGASQRNTGAAAHDTNAPPRGKLPGELLAGPAYKAVAHLGRGTAKRMEAHFNLRGQLSLDALLDLYAGPRRSDCLSLVDAGQRQRVEAELIALTLDFPRRTPPG